jgi:hypothetical protein
MFTNIDAELAHSRLRPASTGTRPALQIAHDARRRGRTARPASEEMRPTLVEPLVERRQLSVLAARPKLATTTARLF